VNVNTTDATNGATALLLCELTVNSRQHLNKVNSELLGILNAEIRIPERRPTVLLPQAHAGR